MSFSLSQIKPIRSRLKLDAAVEELMRLSKTVGVGNKLPTVQDLSKAMGVTIATLDRALKKVEERGIISRKQGSGIYVTERLGLRQVGVVFGQDIFRLGGSPFYLEMMRECERSIKIGHCDFSFYLDTSLGTTVLSEGVVHRDLIEALGNGRLAGLLLAQGRAVDEVEYLRSFGIPVVVLTSNVDMPMSIGTGYRELINMGMEYLTKRGCKRVAGFSPFHTEGSENRGEGKAHSEDFRKAFGRHGVEARDAMLFEVDEDDYADVGVYPGRGAMFVDRMLEQCGGREHLPDGILSADDLITKGACRRMEELGIKPGQDILIVTHANKGTSTLEKWEDDLVFIEFDPQEVAEEMFLMLERLMRGEELDRTRVIVQPSMREGRCASSAD